MSGIETRQTGASTPLSEGSHIHNGGEGGSANIYDRTGLLVAIIALFVSGIGLAVAVMGYLSNDKECEGLQQQINTLMVEIKDLQIEIDEYKNR